MTEYTGLVPKQQTHAPTPQSSGWLNLKKVVIVGGIGAGIYLVYYLLKNRKRRELYVENFEPGLLL